LGLAEIIFVFLYASYSLPKWQALKLTFLGQTAWRPYVPTGATRHDDDDDEMRMNALGTAKYPRRSPFRVHTTMYTHVKIFLL